MEKKYYNCELYKNRQCPQIANPIMQKIQRFKPRKDTEPAAFVSITDINAANQICSECNSFTDNLDTVS